MPAEKKKKWKKMEKLEKLEKAGEKKDEVVDEGCCVCVCVFPSIHITHKRRIYGAAGSAASTSAPPRRGPKTQTPCPSRGRLAPGARHSWRPGT